MYTSDLRKEHGTYKTWPAICCTRLFVFLTVGRIHPPKISNSLWTKSSYTARDVTSWRCM